MKNSPDKKEDALLKRKDRARMYAETPLKDTRKTVKIFISTPPTKPNGAKTALRNWKKGNPQPIFTSPNPPKDLTKKWEPKSCIAALDVKGITQSPCAMSPELVINPKRKKSEIAI
jgi:hypothetical protein